MTHPMRHLIHQVSILMEAAVYLNPDDVPSQLRAGYSGRKFKAEVTERVTIHSDAGLWSGGSRDTYRIIRLADGAELPASDETKAPWDGGRQERVINLEPGIAVVRHTMFSGKDLGLTFYVHPKDAATLLPTAKNDLSDVERKALNAIGGIKSAYRAEEMRRQDVSPQDYEAAKQSLFAKGLIDQRGAITVAGRNARQR